MLVLHQFLSSQLSASCLLWSAVNCSPCSRKHENPVEKAFKPNLDLTYKKHLIFHWGKQWAWCLLGLHARVIEPFFCVRQCNNLMFSRKQACNVKIMKHFDHKEAKKIVFIHVLRLFLSCSVYSVYTVYLLRARSSPLNPFVSLLSYPFFSPVHMQPPEMDRHKKSKASSSKSLCL